MHHTAILGKTGGGKSATAKLLVEQVVADGFRVCVLDSVKSDWWGITSSGDGKKPGLPFRILGGPRGHLPLHSSAGKAIGQLVGAGKLPLSIIDMADFEAGGLQRFFVDFAQALMRNIRGVVYLVVEEAHEMAPKERVGFGAENLAIHWAKKLATAGRSKGIRLIVATQRTQALHNAVLGSCETIIAHRLTTPADQEPVLKWLKANTNKDTLTKVEESLSSLPTGTGWICSGEAGVFERRSFPKFKTYDNTATPTNDAEEVDVKTAPVDAEELRSIIGTAVAEAEANDPKRLKAELAKLRAENAKMQQAKPAAAAVVEVKIERVEVPVLTEADKMALTQQGKRMDGLVDQLQKIQDEFHRIEVEIHNRARPAPSSPSQQAMASAGGKARAAGMKTEDRSAAAKTAADARWKPHHQESGTEIPKGEQAILTAAAQNAHRGGADRVQISILTGYKRSSRDTYIQRLREKGYVETPGDMVKATNAGLDALGNDFEPLPTGDSLREYWMMNLPTGEAKILAILIGHYPDAVDREKITEATGYLRSSRDTYIQRLAGKKLVVPGRGEVTASEELFA